MSKKKKKRDYFFEYLDGEINPKSEYKPKQPQDMSKIKINENEHKVLKFLAPYYDVGGETGVFPFQPIIDDVKLERRVVRLACRSLKRKGLTEYMKALIDWEGMFAGAGYTATEAGYKYMGEPERPYEDI